MCGRGAGSTIGRSEYPIRKGPIRMTAIDQQPALDPAKLEQFVFRAVEEVGATLNAALVVMGDRLGLYRAMADAGPLTSGEIAERAGTASATCASG